MMALILIPSKFMCCHFITRKFPFLAFKNVIYNHCKLMDSCFIQRGAIIHFGGQILLNLAGVSPLKLPPMS